MHWDLAAARSRSCCFSEAFSVAATPPQGEAREYYRAQNSLLPYVLTARRGIPISLAVIHAAVGRRAGLPIECVGAGTATVPFVTPPSFILCISMHG
jgi:regulator of sirC expression with transglutaminase-like and TPR domain